MVGKPSGKTMPYKLRTTTDKALIQSWIDVSESND
jgi:hypothetical protein